jgi:hypothetical protein
MANLISDIVDNGIVQQLNNKLKIIRASAVSNNVQTLHFCDIKWLELYKEFKGGVEVLNIAGNSVDVSTSTPFIVGQELEIDVPKFFHGTPLNTVQEWHEFSTNEREKLPFIWLVTPVQERHQDRRLTVERISNCRILFVHWSNWLELNQNRVNETIRPLHKLVDEFVYTINNNPTSFDRLANNGTRKDYPKFGRETNKGIEEVIMNSTLGAVSLDVELRIKRDLVCCDLPMIETQIFDETFDNTFE